MHKNVLNGSLHGENRLKKIALRYSPKDLMFGVLFSKNTQNHQRFYPFISIWKTLKGKQLSETQFKG